jgi:hypothetical protein
MSDIGQPERTTQNRVVKKTMMQALLTGRIRLG